MFRSNINVLEEDTNTNGQQNQSPPSDEQTIPSIGASFQPLLKHPNEYVKGEATNGMPFTITLNEKGQVLNDEGGRTWRDILHREALRLFGPTITKDFRHQGKTHILCFFINCILNLCSINYILNVSCFILKKIIYCTQCYIP